jgi:hypothetical protein
VKLNRSGDKTSPCIKIKYLRILIMVVCLISLTECQFTTLLRNEFVTDCTRVIAKFFCVGWEQVYNAPLDDARSVGEEKGRYHHGLSKLFPRCIANSEIDQRKRRSPL